MRQLFRLSNTVRHDSAVEIWLQEARGDLGDIARRWFTALCACGADVRETLHDGQATACVGDAAFAYVGVYSEHVTVGFYCGAALADPAGLLEGGSLWASCHAVDVAGAFVAAAGNAATFGRSYHAAGEEWMTWNRMHAIVAEALGGPPPKLVHIPTDLLAGVAKRAFISLVNFQYNNVFDNADAREDLGFRCTVPFAEGVSETVSWLDAQGQILNSDDDPYDDRVIAAWRRCGAAITGALDDLDD